MTPSDKADFTPVTIIFEYLPITLSKIFVSESASQTKASPSDTFRFVTNGDNVFEMYSQAFSNDFLVALFNDDDDDDDEEKRVANALDKFSLFSTFSWAVWHAP